MPGRNEAFQAYYNATHPGNVNPSAPTHTSSSQIRRVNTAEFAPSQPSPPPRPVQASGTVGGGGFSIGDAFGAAVSTVTGAPGAVGVGLSGIKQWAGEKALGWGNQARESGGYRQTSGPMAPAQRYQNVAENTFLRTGERYGENIEAKYEAIAGYAKAANVIVTNPTQAVKNVKKVAQTVYHNPSVLVDVGQEVVKSALTDPTTYAGFGVLGGAALAERSAAKAAAKGLAESGAKTGVREAAKATARRGSRSGRALEAVDVASPNLRELVTGRAVGKLGQKRIALGERLMPGAQTSIPRTFLKDAIQSSPYMPSEGRALGLRQAKHRAIQVGRRIAVPQAYRSAEHTGRLLYDPSRLAQEPAVQSALQQGAERLSSPSVQAAIQSATGVNPGVAAAAAVAGMTAGGVAGAAFTANKIGDLLGGDEEKKSSGVEAPYEEPKKVTTEGPYGARKWWGEAGMTQPNGPRSRYVQGRGHRDPMDASQVAAQSSTPAEISTLARAIRRGQVSTGGGGQGFWMGRPEFLGTGQGDWRELKRPGVARGAHQPFYQRGKKAQEAQRPIPGSSMEAVEPDNYSSMRLVGPPQRALPAGRAYASLMPGRRTEAGPVGSTGPTGTGNIPMGPVLDYPDAIETTAVSGNTTDRQRRRAGMSGAAMGRIQSNWVNPEIPSSEGAAGRLGI